jgi:hypothetical protein
VQREVIHSGGDHRPGRIARASTVQRTRAHLVAVRGRDARAGLRAKWAEGSPISAATDPPALFDPRVNAVYVATPHAFHADAIRRAGRGPLPKALVPDLAPGLELVALARTPRVPDGSRVDALSSDLPWCALASEGAIGRVRPSSRPSASTFRSTRRARRPAQAGGAAGSAFTTSP